MKRWEIKENNIRLVWEVTDTNEIKLLHFSVLEFEEENLESESGVQSFYPVEILVSGQDRVGERHGSKYMQTAPGYRMKYVDFKDYRNEKGRKLAIITEDKITGLEVVSHMQFYDGIAVVRSWTEIINKGNEAQAWNMCPPLHLMGLTKRV